MVCRYSLVDSSAPYVVVCYTCLHMHLPKNLHAHPVQSSPGPGPGPGPGLGPGLGPGPGSGPVQHNTIQYKTIQLCPSYDDSKSPEVTGSVSVQLVATKPRMASYILVAAKHTTASTHQGCRGILRS